MIAIRKAESNKVNNGLEKNGFTKDEATRLNFLASRIYNYRTLGLLSSSVVSLIFFKKYSAPPSRLRNPLWLISSIVSIPVLFNGF